MQLKNRTVEKGEFLTRATQKPIFGKTRRSAKHTVRSMRSRQQHVWNTRLARWCMDGNKKAIPIKLIKRPKSDWKPQWQRPLGSLKDQLKRAGLK